MGGGFACLSQELLLLSEEEMIHFLLSSSRKFCGAMEIDASSNLTEVLDSLTMTGFAREIQQVKAAFKVADLYQHFTISKLAHHLLSSVGFKHLEDSPVQQTQIAASQTIVTAATCEYPCGNVGLEKLVNFFEESQDAVVHVPLLRWDVEEYFSAEASPGCLYTRHGAFLDRDPYFFDESHFNLRRSEVQYMDPQQRLLLETAKQAMVQAEQNLPADDHDSTGVFVGAMTRDFTDMLCKYQVLGRQNGHKMISGLISHSRRFMKVYLLRLWSFLTKNMVFIAIENICFDNQYIRQASKLLHVQVRLRQALF